MPHDVRVLCEDFAHRARLAFEMLENQPLPVVMEDAPLHTDATPFCEDMGCPCHGDVELLKSHLAAPIREGLLTPEEAHRLWAGRQM